MNGELGLSILSLIPKAIAWAEQQSAEVSQTGISLDKNEILIAKQVGVKFPEKIRIAYVETIPVPDDPELQQVTITAGLLGSNTTGLTLGHSVYIRVDHDNISLLSHECRHVYQYEQAGSIANFLPIYLKQIIDHGYDDAPFEVDARNHEISNSILDFA